MSCPSLPKIDPTMTSIVSEQDPALFSMTTTSSGYHSHVLPEQSAGVATRDGQHDIEDLELEKSCCYGEQELRMTQQRIKCKIWQPFFEYESLFSLYHPVGPSCVVHFFNNLCQTM